MAEVQPKASVLDLYLRKNGSKWVLIKYLCYSQKQQVVFV